eukprot:CAMPEP_0172168654 /NCGR_PEP_ID=MMETSP1050-20130122/10268_1 /TAXON_ID=233186 /ORGANISM="Cryptomonas curvata, Strain CCAP979/52" /LENGTH=334 /DNA_ID=CAMNT_0012839621 /DNA_START=320 /DNA_END=1321 /DNA_ORIENTATION=-
MAKLLGVDAEREFYLLNLVRKAVIAPFPQDWSVGVDRNGETYYYNLYTHKVITAHPLSEVFLDWIETSRSQHDDTVRQMKDRMDADGDGDGDDFVQAALHGNPWMKFTTSEDGEEYWYDFSKKRLFTVAQYQYQVDLELKERQAKASNQIDMKKVEKTKKDQKLRKVLGIFTGNLRMKYWLRWTAHILALRAAQAQALIKSGLVSGRQEARGLRQWKEKIEQLAFVRRVMAPIGGRRLKAALRDIFVAWRERVADAAAEREDEDATREILLAWHKVCQRKHSTERVKDVIRGMLRSGSLALNFSAWREAAQGARDREAAAVVRACVALQRRFRE